MVSEPIIALRDDDDGSDSEILIMSSNTRNLKNEEVNTPAKSRDSLTAKEILKLNEVGAAIGVDINGYHDQMKEMVTNIYR